MEAFPLQKELQEYYHWLYMAREDDAYCIPAPHIILLGSQVVGSFSKETFFPDNHYPLIPRPIHTKRRKHTR